MFPAAGPELGYAVLTVEGPGQGLMLHDRDLPMRGDWEAVSDAVLDFLTHFTRERAELELDMDHIAVAGASLGAYFALRAAADVRYKACVAIDPLYDLYDFATSHVAPIFFRLWDNGSIPDWFVNTAVSIGVRLSFQMKWEIHTSARFLGASSAVGLLRNMKLFTLHRRTESQKHTSTTDSTGSGGSYLSRVTCPVFVTGAADSLYFDVGEHTTRVFDDLSQSPDKEMWVGTTPGVGSLQAKMGSLSLCNQRTFEFLDRRLGVER